MRTPLALVVPALAAGLVLIALPGGTRSAQAQNALGAGDALDANPMVGMRGRNSLGDAFVDTRVRNLLITGNVPAGREFRGSVGYTAPRDFRGLTGGDDQYAFRADSALSAGSLTRFGPQYDALRFGGGMDRATYRRDFTVTTSDIPSGTGQDVDTMRTQADAVRLDRLVPASSMSSAARLEAQPQIVGILVDQTGGGQPARLVEASPLRGLVALQGADQRSAVAGLSVYDRLRLEEDAARGLDVTPAGEEFRTSFQQRVFAMAADDDAEPREGQVSDALAEAQRVDTLNIAERENPRVGATADTAEYEQVLIRIAQRYAESQNVTWNLEPRLLEFLDDDYKELREKLTGEEQPEEEPAPSGALTPREPQQPGAENGSLRRLLPGQRNDDESEDGPDKRGLRDLGVVLQHGHTIEQLVSDRDAGRFQQLVRSAEERLQDGEYFFAERRFTRALRFIPGHPLATAGLGHAQLGAGLYRSSALTLRTLLSERPEMIDVRFSESLLPNEVRLMTAVAEIRARKAAENQESTSGFLLAYIGHQLQDPALVTEGLDTMAEADSDDAMVTLLRAVWGDAETSDQNAETP